MDDDSKYCSFKKNGCPHPPKSQYTCFRGDENWCAFAIGLREERETTDERKIIQIRGC
jgi:hypothetical protein